MTKHASKKQGAGASRRPLHRRAFLAAGVVGVLGGGYLLMGGGASRTGRSFSVKGGELAPVLDPLQFQDRNARLAYMAAAKHPETLDQVYCYCYCDRPPTLHKSLLSCFTDRHGAG